MKHGHKRWRAGGLPAGVGLLLALPAPGAAFYFRDDFDGDRLKDHWIVDRPAAFAHRVENGRLIVTGANHPEGVRLLVAVNGPREFTMRMGLRWTQPDPSRVIFAPSSDGFFRNYVRYRRASRGEIPTALSLTDGGGFAEIPLPQEGSAEFRIVQGVGFSEYWVDDRLLYRSQREAAERVAGINFFFSHNQQQNFGEVQIDYVEAVPEPATVAALGLGLAALACRRRKR